MISVEFNRAPMRHFVAQSLAMCLGVLIVAASAWGLLQPHIHMSVLFRLLSTTLFCLILAQVMIFIEAAGIISRGLKKKVPAVIINHTGVVDNASQFALGQLAWNEIERIYPYEQNFRLLTNWGKMPVIFKQRGIAIILRNNADLRHLLDNKPRWMRSHSAGWYQPGRRRWLFIPEMVLPMTAKDLMTQLNTFYVAEVRSY